MFDFWIGYIVGITTSCVVSILADAYRHRGER